MKYFSRLYSNKKIIIWIRNALNIYHVSEIKSLRKRNSSLKMSLSRSMHRTYFYPCYIIYLLRLAHIKCCFCFRNRIINLNLPLRIVTKFINKKRTNFYIWSLNLLKDRSVQIIVTIKTNSVSIIIIISCQLPSILLSINEVKTISEYDSFVKQTNRISISLIQHVQIKWIKSMHAKHRITEIWIENESMLFIIFNSLIVRQSFNSLHSNIM